ncbi:MAG TPA: hypothetical protein VEH53_02120 [archaeon]|nr:hypothetical protein [archaeon]
MPNWLSRYSGLWRLHPDDLPLSRHLTVWPIEGQPQRSARHQHMGQSQQESASAHVPCPPVERHCRRIFRLACHWEIQWQPDPGPTPLAVGEKQSPQGPKLIRRKMREGNSVPNPSFGLSALLGLGFPDYLGLDLDGTLFRLQTDVEDARGGDTFIQLQASAPFTQISGPAGPASGRSWGHRIM